MDKLIFIDNSHEYLRGSIKYQSVSSFVHEFERPFDKEFWSSAKALERMIPEKYKELKSVLGYDHPALVTRLIEQVDSTEFQRVKNEILEEWKVKSKTSTDFGTHLHLVRENRSKELGFENHFMTGKPFKTFIHETEYDNEAISDNLFDLEDGFYPELLLFSDSQLLAGQSDKCFIESRFGRKFIDIDDYKTDNEIQSTSFYSPYRKSYTFMRPPLGHLMQTNRYIYELKISTYAWMAEQHGLTPRYLRFTHINKNTEKEVPYVVPYRKSEVEAMLKKRKFLKKQGKKARISK